jgi:DNA-directed RNA polymerase subunit RPC12/RpoP
MSIVQTNETCEQCGFLEAWKEFNCGTNEWDVRCPRCGYREIWKHESYFSNGHLKKGVNEVCYSAGAYFAKWADNGGAECNGLSETDVEEMAAKMRADIASGKLSPESYVTRYNFETHEVTALVGQVPTSHPLEPESVFKEQTSEAVDEQEDDDLSFEV